MTDENMQKQSAPQASPAGLRLSKKALDGLF